jgi:hypothetical protein
MGSDRAGWYAYDFIDKGAHHSAERILPNYQNIGVGTVLPALPGARDVFLVAQCELEHSLVLSWRLPNGRYETTWAVRPRTTAARPDTLDRARTRSIGQSSIRPIGNGSPYPLAGWRISLCSAGSSWASPAAPRPMTAIETVDLPGADRSPLVARHSRWTVSRSDSPNPFRAPVCRAFSDTGAALLISRIASARGFRTSSHGPLRHVPGLRLAAEAPLFRHWLERRPPDEASATWNASFHDGPACAVRCRRGCARRSRCRVPC